jgi:hypothetical protein
MSKFGSFLSLVFVIVLVTLVTDNRPPEPSAFGGRGAKPTTTIIGQSPYRFDPAAASQNALVIPQSTQSQSARVTHKG